MTTFPLKRGDRLPRYRCRITQGGEPLDLTTATSVRLTMKSRSTGVVKISLGTASVIDGPGGIVEYSWDGDDSDTTGAYDTEWQVTYPGPLVVTAPNSRYDEVVVYERLPV